MDYHFDCFFCLLLQQLQLVALFISGDTILEEILHLILSIYQLTGPPLSKKNMQNYGSLDNMQLDTYRLSP